MDPTTQPPGTGSPAEPAEPVVPQTVADVMTPEVVTVASGARIPGVTQAMRDNDIGDVIVLDEAVVHGIVTDRDVVVRVVAEGADPAAVSAADICSTEIVTAHPGTPVEEAGRVMRIQALRRLPVVDAEGRPQGVVAIGDLAIADDPASALADISDAPPNT